MFDTNRSKSICLKGRGGDCEDGISEYVEPSNSVRLPLSSKSSMTE